jgi:Tol biopolymer transport system component/DNA-binding winged helix-turn-helix (wHTH) protein
MTTPTFPRPLIRFQPFEVDLQSAELRKRGRKVRLQEQPFRVLALLLDRPGEVVTREEIRQKLWPAHTFVDFDHGLNSAVARLREALDDSAEAPQFIETVPRHGYRFIGIMDFSEAADAPSARAASSDPRNENSRKPTAVNRWIAPIALLVALLSFSAWWLTKGRMDTPPASVEVMPLAGMPGYEFDPAFAPDGTEVAFVQIDEKNPEGSGIYTTLVGGEKPLRLTTSMNDCCPAWSPDHRQVAFLRFSRDGVGIYVIPALGGTERQLYRVPRPAFPGLDWSADGKSLAFSEGDPHTGESWITLFSLTDSSTRRLTYPPHEARDETPAFSPDGSQVAFVRGTIAGVANDVFVVPATGGEAKRLTFDNVQTFGVTWAVGGGDIVFASMRGRQLSLWRIPASGGTPQPVAGAGSPAQRPAISRKGDLLAYQQVISKDAIARITLANVQRSEVPPTVLVSEKGSKLRPRFSPDGGRIAFESDRLGSGEIWTCDSAGRNCAQITSLHGTAGTAAWSPDGRFLAFEFHPNERAEIYVVELPNGVPQLLRTIPGADNLAPSWSRDGKWIYFSSKTGDIPFQVWKVPFKGGQPVQVTKNGGIGAIESADGQYLYYSKYESDGVWKMSLDGGEESRVLDLPSGHAWFNWALAPNGIYFLSYGELPPAEIGFLDFATKKTAHLTTLDKPIGWGLALSPDGKSLLYVEAEFAESNIMLVKNFR